VDKRLFITTFVSIFLAEMGDKTQLATLSAASGTTSSRWIVFFASALALVSTTAIAVIGGETVSRFVSPIWLKRAAGALFIILGVVTLWGVRPGAPPESPASSTDKPTGAV
jgi:putative Ca2+/H+ antiporter (TMEM165/GDT1 family)